MSTTSTPQQGLVRYWFEFEYAEDPPGAYEGPACCGVTAFDLDDAKRLLTLTFFGNSEFPVITKLIEDVDVSTIAFPTQADHSIQFAPPIWRGVWYPVQPL